MGVWSLNRFRLLAGLLQLNLQSMPRKLLQAAGLRASTVQQLDVIRLPEDLTRAHNHVPHLLETLLS
jgi:hypothetical protein